MCVILYYHYLVLLFACTTIVLQDEYLIYYSFDGSTVGNLLTTISATGSDLAYSYDESSADFSMIFIIGRQHISIYHICSEVPLECSEVV